jgi:hypothetical protein
VIVSEINGIFVSNAKIIDTTEFVEALKMTGKEIKNFLFKPKLLIIKNTK